MSIDEHRKQMSENRSTLYYYFKEQGLPLRYTKIGKGRYRVFQTHPDWETGYLIINEVRITDFQAVILFTNELVVRFGVYDNQQINIPYKIIKSIEVKGDLNIGYHGIHLNK